MSRSTSQPPTLASTLPPERSTLATARPRLLPVRLCLNMSVANNPTMLPGSANLCLFALRPRPWKQRQGVRRHHRHWQARSRWNGRHWLSLDLGCCWYALTHTAVSIMKRTQPIELCSHLYNPQVLEAVSRSTSPPPTLASTLPLERSTLATARPRLLLVRQFAARVSSASGSLPSNNRPWKQRQGVRRHHRHWQARSRWNGRHWIPLDLGCCWYVLTHTAISNKGFAHLYPYFLPNNRPWKQRLGVRRHHRHWQARSCWQRRCRLSLYQHRRWSWSQRSRVRAHCRPWIDGRHWHCVTSLRSPVRPRAHHPTGHRCGRTRPGS